MGAWEAGNFSNDDAMDWLEEVYDSEDTGAIEEALRCVTEPSASEDLEAGDCSQALAAAELVAAVKGCPAPDLPEEAREWLQQHVRRLSKDLVQLAIRATKRVAKKSELRELWEESDHFAQWQKALQDLQARLVG